MPYEPLHHKYRPQRFAELVGQEAIATTLTHALEQRRIAPAYLFTGPRGTGKTSSARILAKSLNCLNSGAPTGDPCGQCEACRMIALGSSLDVIEIDAASNTGVDNIRELIERAQFAPVQCRYKVYVIDECHMLSTAAFNALLKTLEEPPERVVFVLATTDPQRVLPTIISRCQRFDFRRIPLDAMTQHLTTIAQKEAIDIDPNALYLVAQLSQGGLRDAQSLLDQLSLWEGEITIDTVWDLVGAVPERDLLSLLGAIAQDDAITVLDHLRAMLNRGREPLIVLQNLAGIYRDLLIAKTAPQRHDLVALTADTWTALCQLAEQIGITTILHGQRLLQESERQLKNTTQPRLWLEVTLMSLLPSAIATAAPSSSPPFRPAIPSQVTARPAPPPPAPTVRPPQSQSQPEVDAPLPKTTPPIAEDIPATSAPEEATPAPPQPSSPTPPSATAAPRKTSSSIPATPESVQAELTEARLHRIWQEVVEHLHPLSKALLRDHGRLSKLSDRTAEISMRSQKLMGIAQSKVADVEQAFQEVLGTRIKVVLLVEAAPVESPPSDPQTESVSIPPNPAATAPIPKEPADRGQRSPAPPALQPTEPHARPKAPPAVSAASDAPSSTTPAPDAPIPWQGDDDVTKAAKSLAQMFNGQIVNLDDDLSLPTVDIENLTAPLEAAIAATDPDEVDADDNEDLEDDDLPF